MNGDRSLFAEYGHDHAHRADYRAAMADAQGSLFATGTPTEDTPPVCPVCNGDHAGEDCPHGQAETLDIHAE